MDYLLSYFGPGSDSSGYEYTKQHYVSHFIEYMIYENRS